MLMMSHTHSMARQINLRVESGPLFPLQFSSQSRCTVPTKTYAYSSGYGCWAYVSLYWYEEARFVDTPTFFQYYDHLYSRPGEAHCSVCRLRLCSTLYATML
jgi:hypothetical protein